MGLPYMTLTSTPSTSSISNSNIKPISSNTTDIMMFGCIGSFETVACIRNAVLSFLAVVTALLCVVKVVRLHMLHQQAYYQYIIFYCASLESVIGGVHWVLGSISQLDFVLQWLKLVQFLVMCHYYWTLATRALRREQFAKRFLMPFLLLVCTYFTVIATLGIINVQSTWVECLQPYWLELSAAEFTMVQLFAVAGFYITRRLNEISMLDSVRWAQKRDLWCIIIVFEISALVGFLYDVTLIIVGDENKGCSSIFLFTQDLYSPIFVVFTVIKLLVPIWVMLFVFQPAPPAADQEDLLPAFSDDGTYTSVFSDDQHYRQLYHPAEDYRSTEDSSPSPTPTPTTPSAGFVRRNTSNLDPIKEESLERSSLSTSQSSEHKTKFYI